MAQLIDENNVLKQKFDEIQLAKNTVTERIVATTPNADDSDAKKRCVELEALVRNLEIELSNAIGARLEFDDMKKVYINELDCVQVNLVATEELYKTTKAETMELKAVNASLKQDYKTLKNSLAAKDDELNLIKAQVECQIWIYIFRFRN